MTTDTSPKALDALVKELRTAADLSECYAVTNKAADTIAALRAQLEAHADEYAMACKEIAALRAAPVAMRERAAEPYLDDLIERLNDMRCRAETQRDYATMIELLNYFEAKRALPLDAPAPAVDPVAEARIAAFLKDRDDALGVTEYHTDEERAESARIIATLAQETHHD
jgi:hypothetical protein